MKKEFIFLGLILVFFVITRIYKITEIPASLYWDEASIGYNASSISQSLRDEWGKSLPLHFRAFGEFKLPVYIYSVAVATKILGSNELAIRLPAVFFSVGIILLTYFLAKKLTGSSLVGLLSAFFLSISPWLFIFSRTGYEATAGLMFYLLGIYLFWESRDRPILAMISILAFIASIYSYNSFRILVPLFLSLSIFYLKRKTVPFFVISLIIFATSLIPIYRLVTKDTGAARLLAVEERNVSNIAKNYASHFSLQFLLKGDANARSQQPGFGQIWLIDLPIFAVGLYFLIKKNRGVAVPILFLLLISPIPAALTKESPHALRTISMVPFLAIIWAIGLSSLAGTIKKYSPLVLVSVVVISLSFFEGYYYSFINSYNAISSEDWQYGYKAIFTKYASDFGKYDKVIVSEEYAEPYIFALYYLKYPQSQFQKEVKYNPPDRWGFSLVRSFGKFEFKKISESDLAPKTLVFATPKEKLSDITPDSEIKFLDGTTAFFMYKN